MADDRNKQVTADSSTDADDDLLLVDLANLDQTLLEPSHVRLCVLKRNNYRIWAQSHERFLRSRGMWGIVSGTIPQPTEANNEARNWMILDSWIAVLLNGHIEDSQKRHIAHLERSRDIWNEMKRLHVESRKGCLSPMLIRYFTYIKSPDESVYQMASYLRRLSDEIYNISPEALPSEYLQSILIMNACRDDEYETAKQSLAQMDDLTPALAVKYLQFAEEDIHKSKKGTHMVQENRGKSGRQPKPHIR